MRLATAAAARACGGILSQDEEEQLQYADMLIDVSNNMNSTHCQVIEVKDENVSKLGLPIMQYFTEAEYDSAVEWLYPGGQLDSVQQFCVVIMQVLIGGMPLLRE